MSNKILEDAELRYKEATEYWADNHDEAADDIRFARLGEQWPADILAQRQRERRPAFTINRLPTFIRQVVNDARQSRPAISCKPIDSNGDEETSEVIADLIRHIEYTSDASIAYDTALEHAVTSGFGYWRIALEYTRDDAWDMDIRIKRVLDPLNIFSDPQSMSAASDDWRYCFIDDEIDEDEFGRRWKDADKISWDSESTGDNIGKETIRITEYWTKDEIDKTILKLSDGTVLDEDRFLANSELFMAAGATVAAARKSKSNRITHRILSGADVLDETVWAGRYIPVVPVYGDEIYIDGKRIFRSLIRDAKDSQRMLNYWRTLATELVALTPKAPWIGPRGAFKTDAAKWATANSRSHAFIEYDGPQRPMREPFSGIPSGVIQEALTTSDDMKAIIGMYDASLGARSNETSGRAIMARQREGDVSSFHFLDNLARAITHTGRILVDLIPSVYSTPRILRVMGVNSETRMVTINQPFTHGGGSKIYDLTTNSYDVAVSMGPSYTSKRQETADQMINLIKSYPPVAPYIGDLLASNLDWPGADEISKRLKALLPPQIQRMEQLAQMPPEAQALVAAASLRADQMVKAMEQAKMALNQLKAKVQALETDRHNKAAELALKDKEIQMRYGAQLSKATIDADARADTARIEAAVKLIGDRLDVAIAQIRARKADAPGMDTAQIENIN